MSHLISAKFERGVQGGSSKRENGSSQLALFAVAHLRLDLIVLEAF